MNLVTTILRDIGESLRELFSSSIDELRAQSMQSDLILRER